MIQTSNPYGAAGPKSFWRTGVAEKRNVVNFEIYQKKFEINRAMKIATAGSCFAQHIGNRLKGRGFNVLDYEPAHWTLPSPKRTVYGYSIYSARYGNIYSVRQMLQLVKEAFGLSIPSNSVWKTGDGRYIDALRPGIHPGGLDSPDEVLFHRKYHVSRVRELLRDMDLLIFTLGLTETWRHKGSGTVYPSVPGSMGGEFDAKVYEFVNFSFEEIKSDLFELMNLIDKITSKKKYLFTVSPVPLTATATDDHVLVATTYSKSVLRAVVGELARHNDHVDYFPSYEIVANPWSGKEKYGSNQRSVLPAAVDEVMEIFFDQHCSIAASEKSADSIQNLETQQLNTPFPGNPEDVICEEMQRELLNRNTK